MAKDNDRDHFEDYRIQTEVKHQILEQYLQAYYQVLKRHSENLLYIDAFAGRSTYTKASTGESVDGSPLRALKLIAGKSSFSEQVSAIFIEADRVLFEQLGNEVKQFYATNPHIREPHVMLGTFKDRIKEIIQAVEGNLAPTFLFVDPCGVSGADFDSIRTVMNCDKCEAFIFFNIDGVRRIAGLEFLSNVLVELLGTRERAQELQDGFRRSTTVEEREEQILQHYRHALNEGMGVEFTVPFRVEQEDSQRTSHYLIHATKDSLGFKIMKDVMWRYGHSDDRAGGLVFEQASRTNFRQLFDLSAEEIKDQIVSALVSGPLKVGVICDDWVRRPHDMMCETAYKRVLLELEAAGQIEVLDKTGREVVQAKERRPHKGKPTLGNDYFVRVTKRAQG